MSKYVKSSESQAYNLVIIQSQTNNEQGLKI